MLKSECAFEPSGAGREFVKTYNNPAPASDRVYLRKRPGSRAYLVGIAASGFAFVRFICNLRNNQKL